MIIIEMRDVKKTFDEISPNPYQLEYVNFPRPVNLDSTIPSHFKGIAAYWNKFILTHSDLLPGSGNKNGIYLIAPKTLASSGETEQIIVGSSPETIVPLYPTDHKGWLHPCGTQACGDFMAMGIQADASSCSESEIRIYQINDIRKLGKINHIGTIERKSKRVNGVAMTKESGPNGRYIVAGAEGDLSLYISKGSSLTKKDGSLVEFTEFIIPIDESNGLALVTEETGDIYLITMTAENDGSNNHICLYQLKDLGSQNPACVKIKEKQLTIPYSLNPLPHSFRWGKGIFINTPISIHLYACDRNVTIGDFTILGWTNWGNIT
jgi:hypothetical protein